MRRSFLALSRRHWLILVCVLLALGAYLSMRSPSRPLPILASVPDFSLTKQDGETLSQADLVGKIWVANFVFTHCMGTCPRLTQQMKKVESWMQGTKNPNFKIVSISVDPDRDDPRALRLYAEKYKIDTKRWSFLTGEKAAIKDLVMRGFKQGYEKIDGEQPSLFDIVHGERFVLVDHVGQIRGYYEARPEGLRSLMIAMRRLEKEGRS
jgi:protein SCO1